MVWWPISRAEIFKMASHEPIRQSIIDRFDQTDEFVVKIEPISDTNQSPVATSRANKSVWVEGMPRSPCPVAPRPLRPRAGSLCRPRAWRVPCVFSVCPARQAACRLPMDTGPCNGTLARWLYSAAADACELFAYGGCEGNANNFRFEEECLEACSSNASAVALPPPINGQLYSHPRPSGVTATLAPLG